MQVRDYVLQVLLALQIRFSQSRMTKEKFVNTDGDLRN